MTPADLKAMLARAEAAHARADGDGPRETSKRSCYNCRYERNVSYAVQGDSGCKVYCDHPAVVPVGKRIGDTTWDTPDWCPFPRTDVPALAADVVALVAEVERLREAVADFDAQRDGYRQEHLDAQRLRGTIEDQRNAALAEHDEARTDARIAREQLRVAIAELAQVKAERDLAMHGPIKNWNPRMKRWLADVLLEEASGVDGWPAVETYSAVARMETAERALADAASQVTQDEAQIAHLTDRVTTAERLLAAIQAEVRATSSRMEHGNFCKSMVFDGNHLVCVEDRCDCLRGVLRAIADRATGGRP